MVRPLEEYKFDFSLNNSIRANLEGVEHGIEVESPRPNQFWKKKKKRKPTSTVWEFFDRVKVKYVVGNWETKAQ